MTSSQFLELRKFLEQQEGYRRFPYVDSCSQLTIGIGRNLSQVGLSASEVELLFAHDVESAERELEKYGWWPSIEGRQRRFALLSMMFNLGAVRFATFKRMIAALDRLDYDEAADQMLDSLWARQVGSRAETLASMMREEG